MHGRCVGAETDHLTLTSYARHEFARPATAVGKVLADMAPVVGEAHTAHAHQTQPAAYIQGTVAAVVVLAAVVVEAEAPTAQPARTCAVVANIETGGTGEHTESGPRRGSARRGYGGAH